MKDLLTGQLARNARAEERRYLRVKTMMINPGQVRDWAMVGIFFLGVIALLTRRDDHSRELDLCLRVAQKCEENTHQFDAHIQSIFDINKEEICK